MKKKDVRKLILSKETVRELGKERLDEVKGGSASTCFISCVAECGINTNPNDCI
jgi:hypothetical protein